MKRRHLCDVPGCGNERARWQRLCTRCFSALPRDIRFAILDAWKRRAHGLHRAACRRARDFLTMPEASGRNVTPQQAYARTAAMLGERDEPQGDPI